MKMMVVFVEVKDQGIVSIVVGKVGERGGGEESETERHTHKGGE